MTCSQINTCYDKFNCLDDEICSLSILEYKGIDENYYNLLCLMIGYWELDSLNLFYPFLGNPNIKINQEISNDQRKNFLKMTQNIYKFDYYAHKNSQGNFEKYNSYFYLKIINRMNGNINIIKCNLECASVADNQDPLLGYSQNMLLKFNILDNNLRITGKYFYMGIRTVDGMQVITFDGELLPKELAAEPFSIMDLQNLGIPIFKFDLSTEKRNQSIYLIPYNYGTTEIAPSNTIDIINAKKSAEKKCIKQMNRIHTMDQNCKCIDTSTGLNSDNCPNKINLSDDNITLPKYCSYLSNANSELQRSISSCQTGAINIYEDEIKNINPGNRNIYDRWLKSEANDDNLKNVSNDLGNKYKNINNELMTKCPLMKLGLNGVINNDLRNTVIQDDLVNKVIDKYIENKDEFGLEINYDRTKPENFNILDNGEYYSNLHPLKECKYDSYKLMEQICQDYSLPTDDDPTAFVLPKKCNITDLKTLINECNVKNQAEVPGTTENDILERILPYNFEIEETTGKCNNIKMDTLGLDNTVETWSRMWKEHNGSIERIGNLLNQTIVYEARYLKDKSKSIDIYETSLDTLDTINQKKNCALLGRTWTGLPNEPDDGTNCGEKLESNFKNLLVEKSVPVCMYNKNKFHKKYQKYSGYLKMLIGFSILFIIIYFLAKKFIK